MGPILKFTAGFAIAGFLISLLFGWIGGNRPINIIITAVICALLGGGIGAGTFRFLESRVPEILALFRKPEMPQSAELEYDNESPGFESPLSAGDSGGSVDEGDSPPQVSTSTGSMPTPPAAAAAYGDHILVNKVKIKNEPKLMAAAIRTLLAKDEK